MSTGHPNRRQRALNFWFGDREYWGHVTNFARLALIGFFIVAALIGWVRS